jgi:hypothetical protein
MSESTTVNDIIQLDLQLFKDLHSNNKKLKLSPTLMQKKDEIYKNHKCFHINYETNNNNWTDKKYNRTVRNENFNKIHKQQNKLYIITSDFTEEGKITKQFTSLLNKLTLQNKENIYSKIQGLLESADISLKQTLYEIVWDFIKKSSDIIYIDILSYYDIKITVAYCNKYITEKLWYPPKYAFENELYKSAEELYDLFCDFVKWKKEMINIVKALCVLIENVDFDLELMTNDLYQLFEKHNHRHITDYVLDLLKIIFTKYVNIDILSKLKNIDLNNIDSSTKFLILNIIDSK